MCENRESKRVWVKIPEDLSCTGFARFKYTGIDECIAPIIQALQQGGIDMRGSCCGHNKTYGYVSLQDGRGLLIISNNVIYNGKFQKEMCKLYEKYKEK